jgi:hypothetical protein
MDMCFMIDTSINGTITNRSIEFSTSPLKGPAPYPAEKEASPLLTAVLVE